MLSMYVLDSTRRSVATNSYFESDRSQRLQSFTAKLLLISERLKLTSLYLRGTLAIIRKVFDKEVFLLTRLSFAENAPSANGFSTKCVCCS